MVIIIVNRQCVTFNHVNKKFNILILYVLLNNMRENPELCILCIPNIVTAKCTYAVKLYERKNLDNSLNSEFVEIFFFCIGT